MAEVADAAGQQRVSLPALHDPKRALRAPAIEMRGALAGIDDHLRQLEVVQCARRGRA